MYRYYFYSPKLRLYTYIDNDVNQKDRRNALWVAMVDKNGKLVFRNKVQQKLHEPYFRPSW